MWLDRISGHTTPAATPSGSPPQSTKRSYSPAPPRSSNLAPHPSMPRPGISSRSSSLSLLSNDSTPSLLSSSRRPNGSALKHSATAVDVPDPLEVLERLVGSEDKGGHAAVAPTAEDGYGESEFDLDLDGLSLREIAQRGPIHVEEGTEYAAQLVGECMNLVHIFWISTKACNS
jgi:vacuolar protein sorting-associated protein 52